MIKYLCGGKMEIFADIKDFLMTLSFVDLVFFFAIMVLMILIVTLIYFIKINDEVLKKDHKEETQEMKIIKEITKNLESADTTPNIDFTEYEKDQEDKAIISYEELLNKNNHYTLSYEKEDIYNDDFSVKKFDLDNLVNMKKEPELPKSTGRVISFAKEEAFLQALKQLQKELG